MCGVIGIVGHAPVNQQLFDGLTVLQHRGQDSAGMATCLDGELVLRKHNGLVREVFRTRHMLNLKGNMGIGHVRYPTAGTPSYLEAQPFYVNSPYGIALAHNGNLLNADELKKECVAKHRHINTDSDSEILLNVFAGELGLNVSTQRLSANIVFSAMQRVFARCHGAYTAVAMIVDHGIVAFRDRHGIRPLIYGAKETENGTEYCVASESCALTALGYEIIRDIKRGEVLYIEQNGQVHSLQPDDKLVNHYFPAQYQFTPCIFEYVYLARPDSIIDGVYVHKARIRMGIKLANKIIEEWPDYKNVIDVVIPIPSTSRIPALEMAKVLQVPYREGFTKNRYVGRTFIMPDQTVREKSVRQKLNTLDIEFKGKNVLLVDDSIVRGTTSKDIIRMVRTAGAQKVFFAAAAPPVRYPNVYGIDMPAANELIAHNRTVDEIKSVIGADRLIYQDLADLIWAVQEGNREITQFDCSIFKGQYITGLPTGYLEKIACKRSDDCKVKYVEEEDYDEA